MISYVYASYIEKIDRYGQPILQPITPKDFAQQVRDSVVMGKTPIDQVEGTQLVHLGQYDDKTAEFTMNDKPVIIAKFNDLLPENKA